MIDALSSLFNSLEIAFWGVLTFSILVVLHEGGHFLAARAFGIKVHEFMIGLPGPRVTFTAKSGVTYGVTAIPLGGYVRIAGMEPGAEDELLAPALKAISQLGRMQAEELMRLLSINRDRASAILMTLADWGAIKADETDDVSYVALMHATGDTDAQELLSQARAITYRGAKTWQRITVLMMGVVTNLATAILVFTIVLAGWGYYQQSLTLEDVQEGSAAAIAGIMPGDTVTELDGESVADWMVLSNAILAHDVDDELVITVLRDDQELTFTARLLENENGQAYLGVVAGLDRVDPTVFEAFKDSLVWTGMVFVAIGQFFNPSTFAASLDGARSVVGISVEVAEAARTGPIDYAWWIALLSLSLGAMNLLPIPPLDGGKIVLEIIEKLIGKPIQRRISLGISLVGALLLFSLIGYVMYADVMRYFVAA